MLLSNQPPKGTADWFPEEFVVRKYIFDTWRKVCLRYGYEEYLSPLVEAAEVYRAKSGDEVGGKELVTFKDLGGRELSIRPEMTPSVTRMVTQIYASTPKPIRYFSIANFMRNEKPQRGRNREFWQLNVDLFGAESILAEEEICALALDIMLAFNPPRHSFKLFLNNRKLIEGVLVAANILPIHQVEVVRLLDKYEKLDYDSFLAALGKLDVLPSSGEILAKFLEAKSLDELVVAIPELVDNDGVLELRKIMKSLDNLGYGEFVQFKSSIIRGFDYYDGLVFEIFDNHPDNRRALFGGGRYNGLASLFTNKTFPGIGFAPGDETLKLFLESWHLLDRIKEDTKREVYYIPLLGMDLADDCFKLAHELRQKDFEVIVGLDEIKLTKALEYANKKDLPYLVIYGHDEKALRVYKIKNMKTGEEKTVAI